MLLRVLVAPVVMACILASAVFAFEFGWGRGATDVHRWTFGGAGVALDLFKAALPIFAARAFVEGELARSALCWVAFAFLTVLSLWCAFGTTAGQLAERISNQVVASTTQTSRQATLDRLRNERAALGSVDRATADMVKAQRETVDALDAQIDSERARGGCKTKCEAREADERTARAILLKLQADSTATDKSDDLDRQIAAAEAALSAVDLRSATKEVDPQSASMAKAFGIDQNLVATLSHAVLAIAIEIGSGFGAWLVFGHGAGRRRDDEHDDPEVTACVVETDTDLRLRFFQECMTATRGKRVGASEVHGAYSEWCKRHNRKAMRAQTFGKDAPWPKEKIGGNVYYLNCALRTRGRAPLQLVTATGGRNLLPA